MFTHTQRWRTAVGITLLFAGIGVWFANPVLLVGSMIPVGFVGYTALLSAPVPGQALRCRRTVTPTTTYAGETVTVELLIENTSERQFADLRVVDGVPSELAVVEGSPRTGCSLASGEEIKIEYTLRARYGEFTFSDVTVRTQSVSGDSQYTTAVTPDGESQITARYDPDSYPLTERTLPLAGAISADSGGEGLEFFGTRAYQPTDPASRINWRQYAKERELTTIEYRQDEAAEVLVVVDARPSAGVAETPTAPTATTRCVSMARDIINSMLGDRNRVGALTLGVDPSDVELAATESGDAKLAWIPPTSSQQLRSRIELLLDAAAATVQPDTASETAPIEIQPIEIIDRLSQQTQLVVVTPLCDEYPLELVQQCEAAGYAVNVYSPGFTAQTTPGATVATMQRSLRIATLRSRDTTVVDWNPSEPLNSAFERTTGEVDFSRP